MSESITAAQLNFLNSFLLIYTLIAVCATAVLIFTLFFCVQTPKSKRWDIPFNVGLLLLFLTFAYFIALGSFQVLSLMASLNVIRFGYKSLLINILVPVHTTISEICLSYMVYRIYPRATFRKILLPMIGVFILLRLAAHICANVNYMTGSDTVVSGILFAIGLMWNVSFFSLLFIYRYRKKLKASIHDKRRFRALLNFSVQNAIIPTVILMPLFILVFITKTPNVVTAILVLSLLFRFSLGTLVAYPLFLLNYPSNSNGMKNGDIARFKTIHHTTLQFVTSFGLERKVENILETFLRQIYTIFGGDAGYFVEQTRHGQVSVVCGFSFRKQDTGEIETRIISADDLSEDIPTALLSYGLLLNETKIKDLDSLWGAQDDEIDVYLQDRSDTLSSVLLLPTFNMRGLYRRHDNVSGVDSDFIDLQILNLLAGQLAAALDGARSRPYTRLFSELEEANRNLEDKVMQRTAELELNNKLLQDANQHAMQAAEAKTVFLSNMSHEIRTPISQVTLAAEMLCETNMRDEDRENAQIILNSSKLLLSLVNDILDLSKLENGKVVIEYVPFNLFEIIQITTDAFAVDKNVLVAYYIPPEIPPFVVGDGLRIRQILTNLVGNAVKFTQCGHVLVRLTLIKNTDDPNCYNISLKVIDTGTGIAPENIEKIFKRFEQEKDSITRTYGGTGLGLSICRNLCTLMGSNITVSSKLDYGSTFEFSVRFGVPESNIPAKSSFAHILKDRSRILLLEGSNCISDDPSVLALQLETMGAQIDRQPVSSHVNSNYDLIVIDISSANESINQIYAAQRPGLPILVIHTKEQQSVVEAGARLNNLIVSTLIYPYKQSSLYRRIQDALSTKTSEIQSERLAIQTESSAVDDDTSRKRKAALKILLAEDNLVNQKVFRTMISKLGYSVDIAENGKVAVDMCSKKLYDVIFMDMRMPIMDGLEATREIRSFYSSLRSSNGFNESESENTASPQLEASADPSIIVKSVSQPIIIGLSADVMPENQKEGLQAGMDMYFPKPLSKTKLLEVLNQIIDNRHLFN
ncbi:hypothetical protein BKA69DRAFT_1122679 [Paraphysoderma sedebokerense]|nr:hypothetical protein BKA69DRAFT_1122679 [Paraphysoderma sedebokerense]